MGSCLGGLVGAEQVLARWWAGACCAGCLPTPCPQQSIGCTGNVPTQHGPSKSNSPCIYFLELTRIEESCLAEGEPREVLSPAGPMSPGTGAAASSRGYLRVERLWRCTDPSCPRLMVKVLPAGNINVPSESLSLCVLDTGL